MLKCWFVTSSVLTQMKWLAWGFFADMGKIQSCGPLKWTICCLTSYIYKDMLISFCTTLFRLLTCHTGKVLRVMWSHQQYSQCTMAYFPLGTSHWKSSVFSWVPCILWKNYKQKLECTAYLWWGTWYMAYLLNDCSTTHSGYSVLLSWLLFHAVYQFRGHCLLFLYNKTN